MARGRSAISTAAAVALLLASAAFLAEAATDAPAPTTTAAGSRHDYEDALRKSLLYFEAQRSGRLPHGQRVAWRDHSGLTDGLEQGVRLSSPPLPPSRSSPVSLPRRRPRQMNIRREIKLTECWASSSIQVDLVGGYYDAGDHVKFGLPMAFTVTMLSWSLVEYGADVADAGELRHALQSIKWGTDYFIKAHTGPDELWAEVILLLQFHYPHLVMLLTNHTSPSSYVPRLFAPYI
jgi:hypothetical protein